MKLIWHADGLREREWIRDMLNGLVDQEIMDLELTCFDDDSIHVVSSNWLPLSTYQEYFRHCRERCVHIALFHASDEWFSGGYALYRYFDLVIRNFHTRLADCGGIITIPEGYPDGTKAGAPVMPADERGYACSFIGELKASRMKMARAFDGFSPQLFMQTASISDPKGKKLDKAAFDAILHDTVFSPCPMGNAILETWRLYESLELGCIPLVEERLGLDYFGAIFGPNPIPKFRSWADARVYAELTFRDKNAVRRIQREVGNWWAAHKTKVRAQLREALLGPSRTQELQRFAALARNRFPMVHEPLRIIELVRHQNRDSLQRRLARPAGPLKRIAADSLGRFRGRLERGATRSRHAGGAKAREPDDDVL